MPSRIHSANRFRLDGEVARPCGSQPKQGHELNRDAEALHFPLRDDGPRLRRHHVAGSSEIWRRRTGEDVDASDGRLPLILVSLVGVK